MSEIYDVIIIGSGPAGLSAAVYAKRAKLNTLVIEKSAMSGGQVLTTYEVDNYLGLLQIGGFELGMKFREHADKLGVTFAEADVTGMNIEKSVKEILTSQGTIRGKAIVLATGANYAKLGVAGEEEFMGMGVSYCATCDGAFFQNKTVAVIGGGDVAVEDAIFLARGCEKVYLIHRREELRAAKVLQENLFSLPNVEILWNNVAKEIIGTDKVERLKIENVKTKIQEERQIDGVFVAVGIRPNSDFIPSEVSMDQGGYVIAAEDGITNQDGIFVAGDLRTKQLRQIVTAVSDGANVITSVQNYFINNS